MVIRKHCIQIWIDIALFITFLVVFVTMTSLSSWIRYAQRGFFCDDVTIRYPYRTDTVTMLTLLAYTTLVPLVLFIGTEIFTTVLTVRHTGSKDPPKVNVQVGLELPVYNPSASVSVFYHACCPASRKRGKCQTASAVAYNVARLLSLCMFGLIVTLAITMVGKISIGRLRPHFIDVCRPNVDLDNCTSGTYITEYRCKNDAMSRVQKEQIAKSFPSGHASESVFIASFLSYYIHKRLHSSLNTYTVLLKPILQMFLIVFAFFTCLSRVTDNMHHFTDVLVGGAIGAAVAYWMTMCLEKSLVSGYHPLIRPQDISGEEDALHKISDSTMMAAGDQGLLEQRL